MRDHFSVTTVANGPQVSALLGWPSWRRVSFQPSRPTSHSNKTHKKGVIPDRRHSRNLSVRPQRSVSHHTTRTRMKAPILVTFGPAEASCLTFISRLFVSPASVLFSASGFTLAGCVKTTLGFKPIVRFLRTPPVPESLLLFRYRTLLLLFLPIHTAPVAEILHCIYIC